MAADLKVSKVGARDGRAADVLIRPLATCRLPRSWNSRIALDHILQRPSETQALNF